MKFFHNIEAKPVNRDGMKFYVAYGGGNVWRVRRGYSDKRLWKAFEQASPWRMLDGRNLDVISEKLSAMQVREAA